MSQINIIRVACRRISYLATRFGGEILTSRSNAKHCGYGERQATLLGVQKNIIMTLNAEERPITHGSPSIIRSADGA